MKFIRRFTLIAAALLIVTTHSFAVLPEEVLPDPALEARARVISQDLRCLVCQNQSIDDSNAPLAKDLRVIVRERLTAGDSNDQVFGYVVSRYGNYVLLKPPLQADTFLLWASPFIILVIALSVALIYLKRRPEIESSEGIEADAISLNTEKKEDRI
jgi:cytochrome c-type biogenesis protein CcmH